MRKITQVFEKLDSKKEGALIAYITAGDPNLETTSKIVETLAKAGADIIELGIPFSDPVADGPTIQAASERALEAKTTPIKVIQMTKKLTKKIDIPIVFMTYYNPIFKMGVKEFFKQVKEAGVSGIIVPDLPPQEAQEYKKIAEENEIDTIFLTTPNTSTQRLKKILEVTSGFLYLVSIFGVTGTRNKIEQTTLNLIKTTKVKTQNQIPLAVGFGISKPEHVKTVIQGGAKAAIVGSGFVEIIQQNKTNMLKKLATYCKQLKKATQ